MYEGGIIIRLRGIYEGGIYKAQSFGQLASFEQLADLKLAESFGVKSIRMHGNI